MITFHGSHVFNPSNFGLVLCFLVLGPGRAEPLDFWWGPMTGWLALALAIIVVGGLAILIRLRLIVIAVAFWVTFAAALAVLSAAGAGVLVDAVPAPGDPAEPGLSQAALRGGAHHGSPGLLAALHRALVSPDGEVRQAALTAAAGSPLDPGLRSVVERLAEADPDAAVRERAVQLLATPSPAGWRSSPAITARHPSTTFAATGTIAVSATRCSRSYTGTRA